MGNCWFVGSTSKVAPAPNSGVNEQQNAMLDMFLAEEKLQAKLAFKLLVLGAGESGKTTFSTQLRLIYGIMSMEDSYEFTSILPANSISCMQNLIRGARLLDMSLDDVIDRVDTVMSLAPNSAMSEGDAANIYALWKSAPIRRAYERRNQFYFPETGPYYFENVLRFAEANFTPTEEDVIMARVRTTGMIMTEFVEGTVSWQIVDVGGQRSERKKWIRFFDNVKAVLYVVDLAGYNCVLFEDAHQNRMVESLSLFEETVAHPAFANTDIFLLLNKEDLFLEMLKTHGLEAVFPEYVGTTAEEAIAFVTKQFEARLPASKRLAGTITMTSRYRESVRNTMEFIMEAIVEWNRHGIKKAMRAISESHHMTVHTAAVDKF